METLTMQGIADLAGVQRPVVSMWRRRHADGPDPFPSPVTHESLAFEASEVARWLARSRLGHNEHAELEAALYSSAFQRARQHPDHASALLLLQELTGEPVDALGAGAAAQQVHLHGIEAVLTAEQSREALDDQEMRSVVDELAEAAFSGERVLDRIIRTFTDAGGPWSREALTSGGERLLGTVLAELWRAQPRSIVPRGPAGLLLARVLTDHLDEQDRPAFVCTRSTLKEPSDRAAWRLLAARRHSILAAKENAWPEGSLILVQHQAARSETDFFDGVEDLLLGLDPRDTLVVVGPASLMTDPRGARARRELLAPSSSYVAPLRYVARLPKGLSRFGGRRRLALWVFAPSLATPAWTVVGAHSDTDTDLAACTGIAADVAAATAQARDVNAHAFRSSRVLASDRVLARDELTVPPSEHPRLSGGERLARVWELDRGLLDGLDLAASDGIPQTLSLKQASRTLGRDLTGHRIPIEHIGPPGAGTVTVIGPQEIRDPALLGQRAVDRLTLEDVAPRARFTEPRDVIYVAAGGPAAFVDHEGGHLVLAPARVFRCRDAEQDDRQLVPSVVAADIGTQRGPDRDTWRLRTVPVDRAAALEEIDRRARERRQLLLEELSTLDELEKELTNGLSAGTLTATPREEEAKHP